MTVLTNPLGWFTVEVPSGWSQDTEDCVTTLRSPRGLGIAYVSVARHARGPQPEFGGAAFLCRFLRSLGLEVEEAAVVCRPGPGCRVFSHERETNASRWWFWSVTDEETALLLSYSHPLEADGAQARQEQEEVQTMVESVRLYHSSVQH